MIAHRLKCTLLQNAGHCVMGLRPGRAQPRCPRVPLPHQNLTQSNFLANSKSLLDLEPLWFRKGQTSVDGVPHRRQAVRLITQETEMDHATLRAICEYKENPCRASSRLATFWVNQDVLVPVPPQLPRSPSRTAKGIKASILIATSYGKGWKPARFLLVFAPITPVGSHCGFTDLKYRRRKTRFWRLGTAAAPLDERIVSADAAGL
ncbi:hypothetical protein EDB84DRAFT_223991 [Lactarius hengduanensis]|nr:hypothetical protein EDB84DRAFT_223991 [Lactarius hengduanensis]